MVMRKGYLALAALACILSAPFASATPSYSPTYIAISTFTPGASLTVPFAFKNASSLVDVKVQRIEVSACSTGTVTGGIMQFWLYTSTTVTNGSVVQVSSYVYDRNWTWPANVIGSTSPTTVQYEAKLGSQLPFSRPLIINNDETATDHFSDAWDASEGNEEPQALVLLKSTNRGFVLEKRAFGTTDVTNGCVMVKVLFTAK
jgi:hypothetical protein